MPSINDSRKTIMTQIPSIPGSEVELWDTLTIGDAEKITSLETDYEKGMMTLMCLIKKWNLDEACEIKTIKQLGMDDLSFLIQQTSYGSNLKKTVEQLEDESAEKKTA